MTVGTDTVDRSAPRIPLLARWILATAAGTLLGTAVGAALFAAGAAMVRAVHGPAATVVMFAFTAVGAAAAGSVLGLAQSMVLSARLEVRAGAWVLATTAGALAAVFVSMVVGAELGPGPIGATSVTLVSAAGGALVGTVIGVAQWIVLARSLTPALPWVAASAVGWSAGTVLATRTVVLLEGATNLPEVVVLIAVGGVALGLSVGAVTGMWLRRAANKQRTRQHQ